MIRQLVAAFIFLLVHFLDTILFGFSLVDLSYWLRILFYFSFPRKISPIISCMHITYQNFLRLKSYLLIDWKDSSALCSFC